METLTLDTPTEARARVALAIYHATRDEHFDIAGYGVIDLSNVWTDQLPHLAAQLRAAAVTETDHETERALLAAAHHADTIDAARWAHRMEGLTS